jgi:uncharacterized protein (TIGR02246 family)
MRRSIAALALGLLAACAAPGTGPGPEGMPMDLAAAHMAYAAAWAGTDRAALASFFTDDARVIFRDYTLEGRAQIEARWLMRDVGRVTSLVMASQQVARLQDEVTESGTVTLRFRRESGEVSAEAGTYQHVWARQPDGAWKLRSVRMDTHPAPPQ